jgi:hypothetical protein
MPHGMWHRLWYGVTTLLERAWWTVCCLCSADPVPWMCLQVPALTHSLASSLTHSLTREPKADYYCYNCKLHSVFYIFISANVAFNDFFIFPFLGTLFWQHFVFRRTANTVNTADKSITPPTTTSTIIAHITANTTLLTTEPHWLITFLVYILHLVLLRSRSSWHEQRIS